MLRTATREGTCLVELSGRQVIGVGVRYRVEAAPRAAADGLRTIQAPVRGHIEIGAVADAQLQWVDEDVVLVLEDGHRWPVMYAGDGNIWSRHVPPTTEALNPSPASALLIGLALSVVLWATLGGGLWVGLTLMGVSS